MWGSLSLYHCVVVVGGSEFMGDLSLSCGAGRIDASSEEVHGE